MLALALTVVSAVWLLLLLSAPFAVSHGAAAPASLGSALVYGAAGRICHQQDQRSFHLAGIQQPVCARCFGLYASGAIGAVMAWMPRRRRYRERASRDRWVLLACALPTVVSWGLEQAAMIAPGNALRAFAAVPLGLAAGWIFIRALRDEV